MGLRRRSRDDYRFFSLVFSEFSDRSFGEEQEIRLLGIPILFPFPFSPHRAAPGIGIGSEAACQKGMSEAELRPYLGSRSVFRE